MFFWFFYNFLNDHICKGLVCHRLFLVGFFWLRQPVRTEWKEKETEIYTLLLLYNLLIYKKKPIFIDKLLLQVAWFRSNITGLHLNITFKENKSFIFNNSPHRRSNFHL